MEFSFSQQLEIFFIVAILLVALYFQALSLIDFQGAWP